MDSRRRIEVGGIVQGVGFRPFVFRLAAALSLSGWVTNTSDGVLIEVEGGPGTLEVFTRRLREEAPPLARITALDHEDLPSIGYRDFTIRGSIACADRRVLITPDVAICADCRRELLDPSDRRYHYPFINCTNCGPRYTIIHSVPYDRPGTSMASFRMCPPCQAEYDDPSDRRFHAQPNACDDCGPHLTLLDGAGKILPGDPLAGAVRMLGEGRVLAIKGIGGFHLAADPCREEAVRRLRERKKREEKPFALMVRDVETAALLCRAEGEGRRLLASTESPIVLLPKRPDPGLPVSNLVAPRSRWFGLMLPAAPLHVLLMEEFPALIMTSGNLSDEPLCAGNDEALARLAGVADAFLVHDRDIVLRCDDSIVRPAFAEASAGRPLFAKASTSTKATVDKSVDKSVDETADKTAGRHPSSFVVLRRARGFVPAPVSLPGEGPPVLALGAEMKGSICVTRKDRAFIGQHLGDLENEQAGEFLLEVARHLLEILEVKPRAVACDLHPGYLSTRLATEGGFGAPWDAHLPVFFVQHHHAHVLSVQAECGRTGPVLGLALDGTGYGPDGTVWGGEILLVSGTSMRRMGRLSLLWMPGGEKAIREPSRLALSLLVRALGEGKARELAPSLFPELPDHARNAFLDMAAGRRHGAATSSAGRLFDAFSALLGVCRLMRYEGQPAIELEMLTDETADDILPYLVEKGPEGLWEADLAPAFAETTRLSRAGVTVPRLGGMFHHTLARALAETAARCREETGEDLPVALSGGVLQNEIFSGLLAGELARRGMKVLAHRLVPANDGGISLGQAVYARCALAEEED